MGFSATWTSNKDGCTQSLISKAMPNKHPTQWAELVWTQTLSEGFSEQEAKRTHVICSFLWRLRPPWYWRLPHFSVDVIMSLPSLLYFLPYFMYLGAASLWNKLGIWMLNGLLGNWELGLLGEMAGCRQVSLDIGAALFLLPLAIFCLS